MLYIENDKEEIINTNYWDSDFAQQGLLYLSWNSNCARLLIPDQLDQIISEIRTGLKVIISKGPWPAANKNIGLEILFDDHTQKPFSIHLAKEQTDFTPDKDMNENQITFSAWTRKGKQYSNNAKYRIVNKIPCLMP